MQDVNMRLVPTGKDDNLTIMVEGNLTADSARELLPVEKDEKGVPLSKYSFGDPKFKVEREKDGSISFSFSAGIQHEKISATTSFKKKK